MRGKAGEAWQKNNQSRITPAYAGKSSGNRRTCCGIWDHPRLCGEKQKYRKFKRFQQGSPPPMRGKGVSSSSTNSDFRITPAYAGKSGGTGFVRNAEWDHPRLCGEKFQFLFLFRFQKGSPPPMRGKVSLIVSSRFLPGITPAYAGKRIRM